MSGQWPESVKNLFGVNMQSFDRKLIKLTYGASDLLVLEIQKEYGAIM